MPFYKPDFIPEEGKYRYLEVWYEGTLYHEELKKTQIVSCRGIHEHPMFVINHCIKPWLDKGFVYKTSKKVVLKPIAARPRQINKPRRSPNRQEFEQPETWLQEEVGKVIREKPVKF